MSIACLCSDTFRCPPYSTTIILIPKALQQTHDPWTALKYARVSSRRLRKQTAAAPPTPTKLYPRKRKPGESSSHPRIAPSQATGESQQPTWTSYIGLSFQGVRKMFSVGFPLRGARRGCAYRRQNPGGGAPKRAFLATRQRGRRARAPLVEGLGGIDGGALLINKFSAWCSFHL